MDYTLKHKKSGQKFTRYFKHKYVWIVSGLFLLGLFVAVMCYLVFFNHIFFGNPSSTLSSTKDKDQTAAMNNITTTARNIVADKGNAAGQAFLDSELVKTNDVKEQSRLYLSKSVIEASESGGNDQAGALEYGIKAESLSPSRQTALNVAILEDNLGNNLKAIEYYKLYLNRLYPDIKGSEILQGDYEYYSNRITELESENNL